MMSKMFFEKAFHYFASLTHGTELPLGISALNPYISEEIKRIIKAFYQRFYSDYQPRIYIIGINPGRFGGGVTGIGFTDPVALREYCGIENNLGFKRELSSQFIYSVIEKMGGVSTFFSSFYLTAMYPLALMKEDKNYNYYDDETLYACLKKDIIESLQNQLEFNACRDVAVCLGKENLRRLQEINAEHKMFKKIVMLEHPRYIMQYKRKHLDDYVKKYTDALYELKTTLPDSNYNQT